MFYCELINCLEEMDMSYFPLGADIVLSSVFITESFINYISKVMEAGFL